MAPFTSEDSIDEQLDSSTSDATSPFEVETAGAFPDRLLFDLPNRTKGFSDTEIEFLSGLAKSVDTARAELEAARKQQAISSQRLESQADSLRRLLLATDWPRLARSRRFSAVHANLIPGPQLVPIEGQPASWRCRAANPYLEANCLFPRGWIRLELHITRLDRKRPERETAEVFADFGAGYAHAQALERIHWYNRLDETPIFIYLPRPVIGLRLQPLQGPATFAVEHFRAIPLSPRQALTAAIRRKIQRVRRAQRLGRSMLKALRLFVTGRWFGLWHRLFRALPDSAPTRSDTDVTPETVGAWWKRQPLPENERDRAKADIEAMVDPPILTLLLTIDQTPDSLLRTVLESVRRQTYPHWRLIAHLSPRTAYPHPVLEAYAEQDHRFRSVPALAENDAAGAWQDLLDALETPQVVVMNPGYELAETALHRLVVHLRSAEESDWVVNGRPLEIDATSEPTRRAVRLFRTTEGAEQLNVFRRDDLRRCRSRLDSPSLPLGLDLSSQLLQQGKKPSYLAESLTYYAATLAQVPLGSPGDDDHGPIPTNTMEPARRIAVTGDVMGLSGWDRLVFEIARGLNSLGFEVRLNDASTIDRELLPPYMTPMIRPRSPHDRELTICSPYFLSHHRPLPGNAIFTMWEADTFDREWIAVLNRASQVFVPSRWGAETMRAAGVTVPIAIIPLGHDTLTFHPGDRYPDVCTFGTAAALWGGGIRKNVDRLIEAFQKAFPDELDVRLRVKITSRCELPESGDPRIEILRTYLRPEDLADWYRSLSVFVNTSYSEGFGLHLLEAMACGRPLISASYSGVTAYFDEQVGYPIEYRMVPIRDNAIYRGRWAEPDEISLIAALRRVYDEPAEARSKGGYAAARARCLTWKDMGRKLAKALQAE